MIKSLFFTSSVSICYHRSGLKMNFFIYIYKSEMLPHVYITAVVVEIVCGTLLGRDCKNWITFLVICSPDYHVVQ